jgi:hypothetical protein
VIKSKSPKYAIIKSGVTNLIKDMKNILTKDQINTFKNQMTDFEKSARECRIVYSTYQISRVELMEYAEKLRKVLKHTLHLNENTIGVWCDRWLWWKGTKEDFWELYDKEGNFIPYDLEDKDHPNTGWYCGEQWSWVPVGYSNELISSVIRHDGKIIHRFDDQKDIFYYVVIE